MSPSRERSPSRHRGAPPARPDDAAADAALSADGDLDSYLAALSQTGAPDAGELTGRFGSAQVFQLRLPALRIEQLRRIAQERGVSPAALAVDWVIERLDREDTVTGPLPVVAPVDAEEPVEADEPRRRGLRRFGRRIP